MANQPPKNADSPSPASSDKNSRSGLERLQQRIQSSNLLAVVPVQKPKSKAQDAGFCKLFQPMDTYQTFAARHPEYTPIKAQYRVIRLRKHIPGLIKNSHLSPWQVAQMYLATLPELYRRSTEP